MVQRLLAASIIAFWIVMMALLVRLELYPEQSSLANIPVAVVTKLMFLHGQSSDLNIYENGQPVGRFSLHPKTSADGRHRSLDFSGGMHLRLPLVPRQRLQWDGFVEMDRASAVESMRVNLALRDPAYKLQVALPRGAAQATYELKQGEEIVQHSTFGGEAGAVDTLLKQLGVDEQTAANLRVNLGAPTITAKRTELPIRTEKIFAYLLTVKHGDAVMASIYVSQLGQVLKATTALGFTLAPPDAFP